MRCKACNIILREVEIQTVTKKTFDIDLCKGCLTATHNAIYGVEKATVTAQQEATGFNNVWG